MAASSKFVKNFVSGQNVTKCAFFVLVFAFCLFVFFFYKIIKPLFYPLQLLSFSYARKKIHACTEFNLYL